MKPHLIVFTAAAIAAALGASCTSGPGAPVDQQSQTAVLQWRADKDAMFKTSDDSPLLPDARVSFTGLSYWPIDTAYRVPAGLTQDRSGPPVIIQLQTSTNQKRRMQKVGALGFTLKQQTWQLTAFVDLDTNDVTRLFVPFGDLTNNKETYGGGRYIELNRTPTGLYDLDFNRAYHPFCVFNPNYDCPVPPRENRLQVAIPVGERLERTALSNQVMRRGVVFDFDGVLADSEGLHLAAFQDVLNARGWTMARATYFDRYLGYDDRDLLKAFLADHDPQVPAAELDAIVAEKGRKYDARVQGGDILFPAAAACVARLRGAFALGIASGSLHEEITDILRANHLEQAFEVVVGADDVLQSKPAPDSYAAAVQRLGVRPEDAVAIEDSHWGLTAARAAGLRTIGITTSYPRHALRSADAVIDSLDEVTPEFITGLLAVR